MEKETMSLRGERLIDKFITITILRRINMKDNKGKKDSKYIRCDARVCLFSVKPERTVYCTLMPRCRERGRE
jgi:hypothetical protein